MSWTTDEVLQVLRNVGVDVECGACAEIAFTSVTTNSHTCVNGVASLEARLGPKPWCPDCGHPFADFHSVIGCQHLIPVYIDGRLSHHDKCRCPRGA